MKLYKGKKTWVYDVNAPFRRTNIDYKLLTELLPAHAVDYFFRIGIDDYNLISSFTNPIDYFNLSYDRLYDDLMKKAILLFDKGIKERRPVYIYTDYDADGALSATMLLDFLQEYFNYRIGSNMFYRVSDRDYGYGINKLCVDDVVTRFTNAIVFILDTGTSSIQELTTMLTNTNSYFIVIDHHECNSSINFLADNNAFAYCNPKHVGLLDYYNVCTGGLVYFFISLLDRYYNMNGVAKQYLDMAAVATISDYMTMDYVNKSLVIEGAKVFVENQRPIFYLLGDIYKYDTKIDYDNFGTIVGFYIAPKLNAPGRANNAWLTMEALLAGINNNTDISRLIAITEQIRAIYNDIKQKREIIYSDIMSQIDVSPESGRIIFYHSTNIDIGIISAVASKISGEHNVPAIITSYSELYGYKGSGRIPLFLETMYRLNIVGALKDAGLHITGHKSAFGVRIDIDKIAEVEENLVQVNNKISHYKQVTGANKSFIDCIISTADELTTAYNDFVALGPAKNRDEAPKIAISASLLNNYQNNDLCIISANAVYTIKVGMYDKTLTRRLNKNSYIIATPLLSDLQQNNKRPFKSLVLDDIVENTSTN